MASLNKVILMGYMTADPELKQTPSGVSVCTFRLGIARRYKDADGKTVSDFITCVAWRQTAEFVCKYFKKGASTLVVGSLSTRTYEDQQGGKRQIVEVTVDEVSFGASRGGGASAPMPLDGDAPPAPVGGQGAVSAGDRMTSAAPPTFEPLDAENDLPF